MNYTYTPRTQLGKEVNKCNRYVITSPNFLLHTEDKDEAIKIFLREAATHYGGYLHIFDCEEKREIATLDI